MGEALGEALILTIIQAMTNFDADNTSREDWKIINSGKSALGCYAIIRPGPFENEWMGGPLYVAHWTTIVELWQRYQDDATTAQSLAARRDEIIAAIMAKNKLGDTTGTIQNATVLRGDEPEEIWDVQRRKQVLTWLRSKIYVRWDEEATVIFS